MMILTLTLAFYDDLNPKLLFMMILLKLFNPCDCVDLSMYDDMFWDECLLTFTSSSFTFCCNLKV